MELKNVSKQEKEIFKPNGGREQLPTKLNVPISINDQSTGSVVADRIFITKHVSLSKVLLVQRVRLHFKINADRAPHFHEQSTL